MKSKILAFTAMFILLCSPVSAFAPMDLNGDGLYEDLNENGILDFDDVVKLYEGLDSLNVSEYDFNGDSVLDFGDVETLYDYL